PARDYNIADAVSQPSGSLTSLCLTPCEMLVASAPFIVCISSSSLQAIRWGSGDGREGNSAEELQLALEKQANTENTGERTVPPCSIALSFAWMQAGEGESNGAWGHRPFPRVFSIRLLL